MPTGLLLELGKEKPAGDDKSKPMGDSGELDEFDAALDDAFEAVKSGDKGAFKDALSAAISAKCAEMYSDESGPSSEKG